jgi:hypothetical protein
MQNSFHSQLDPTKTLSSSPTLGEEHIINVELDRNTPLKEADTSISEEIRWDHGLWCKREGRKGSSPNAVDSVSDAPGAFSHDSQPLLVEIAAQLQAYIQALHTLLPSFPLTKKDVKLKGRSADAQLRKLPYRLVANPTVLKSLVTGRRKAIEVRAWWAVPTTNRSHRPMSLVGTCQGRPRRIYARSSRGWSRGRLVSRGCILVDGGSGSARMDRGPQPTSEPETNHQRHRTATNGTRLVRPLRPPHGRPPHSPRRQIRIWDVRLRHRPRQANQAAPREPRRRAQ